MLKTHHLLALCLSISTQFLYAQSSRQKLSLDANWKFHLGHSANPAKDFNYGIANIFAKTGAAWGTSATDAKFNDSAWATVNLPHDWAVELPFVKSDNSDVDGHGYKPVGGAFPETISYLQLVED
jgi:beta-galactosidase